MREFTLEAFGVAYVVRETDDGSFLIPDAVRPLLEKGTALKPAWEPICVARKPLIGTVAANVLAHGTGALNIDGCRVETSDDLNGGAYSDERKPSESEWVKHGGTIHSSTGKDFVQPLGRWPANLLHDGSPEVVALFPAEAGAQAPVTVRNGDKFRGIYGAFAGNVDEAGSTFQGDSGSAARFFWWPKTSAADRQDGLQHPGPQFKTGSTLRAAENLTAKGNCHPTVKPTELMRYLCRLVTPPIVWYCPTCEGESIDSAKTAYSATAMRDMPNGIQAAGQPQGGEVLQQAVRGQGDGVAAEVLRAVRDGVQADAIGEREAAQPVLQPSLWFQGIGSDEAETERPDEHEGLCTDPNARSSDGDSRGLRHGAQACHGAESGADADEQRGRAPHQREQGGQPAGQLGVDAKVASRQVTEAEVQADSLSSLPRADRSERTCPKCQGHLASRPGVVLDPFMGSGSTLKAAELEGFSAIGIELDPAYVEIAKRRIGADAPLFAEVRA